MVARGTAQLIAGAQPSIVFVDATHPLVRRATDGLAAPDGIAWIVDVDPVEML